MLNGATPTQVELTNIAAARKRGDVQTVKRIEREIDEREIAAEKEREAWRKSPEGRAASAIYDARIAEGRRILAALKPTPPKRWR